MKRKIFNIIIIIVSIFIITSCKSETINYKSNKNYIIKLIPKSSDNNFWKSVYTGAIDASEELGVSISYEAPDNEKDIDVQIKIVEEAIDDKVDAIVLASTDYIKLINVVEKAIGSGIPVIVIDSNVNTNKISGFIGTNNNEAAKKATSTLINLIGEEGKVAIMNFVKGTATANEREDGVVEMLNSQKKIEIVDKLYCLSNESIAEELTRELIRKNPELKGIIALNGPATTGTARAIDSLGLNGKIKVVGFDSTEEEIDYLEDNALQSTVIQNPYNIGYLGVKYACYVLNNMEVPSIEYTESTVINKDNMYLPKNQKLLFPFIK